MHDYPALTHPHVFVLQVRQGREGFDCCLARGACVRQGAVHAWLALMHAVEPNPALECRAATKPFGAPTASCATATTRRWTTPPSARSSRRATRLCARPGRAPPAPLAPSSASAAPATACARARAGAAAVAGRLQWPRRRRRQQRQSRRERRRQRLPRPATPCARFERPPPRTRLHTDFDLTSPPFIGPAAPHYVARLAEFTLISPHPKFMPFALRCPGRDSLYTLNPCPQASHTPTLRPAPSILPTLAPRHRFTTPQQRAQPALLLSSHTHHRVTSPLFPSAGPSARLSKNMY